MELQVIQNKIYEIRGVRVMLDYDLAEMYQVETRPILCFSCLKMSHST